MPASRSRRPRVRAGLVALALAAGAAPATAQELPLVYVLSTGGTIAGRGSSAVSLAEYKSAQIAGAELVEAVPEIRKFAEVRVEQIANIGSTNMHTGLWLKLAARINAIFAENPKVSGVVVTHGTNTLEETAYFLHLTVRHDRPVVLVGAQRPATAISADGPLNLLNAIRVAGAPESRGKGALVVLNEEINGARDVSKSNTYRAEAFRSGELGFLGYVDQDRVSYYKTSTRRHTAQSEFDVSQVATLPKVEIVLSYAEAGSVTIHALGAAGVDGIVFAGTGAGGLSDHERAAVKALGASAFGRRIALVRASRTGNGRVIARKDYDAEGFIPADNLSAQKARVLLMVALTRTRDAQELRRIFEQY